MFIAILFVREKLEEIIKYQPTRKWIHYGRFSSWNKWIEQGETSKTRNNRSDLQQKICGTYNTTASCWKTENKRQVLWRHEWGCHTGQPHPILGSSSTSASRPAFCSCPTRQRAERSQQHERPRWNSRLQPGPALAVVGIWGAKQQMARLCIPLLNS